MARSLIPFVFGDFPELTGEKQPASTPSSDVTMSEDKDNIYIQASVPGVKPEEVELTFHQGILYIKGEHVESEEDKKRNYFRKSTGSFSYSVTIPGDLDDAAEPQATCKHGVVTITFHKAKHSAEPRKIRVDS